MRYRRRGSYARPRRSSRGRGRVRARRIGYRM